MAVGFVTIASLLLVNHGHPFVHDRSSSLGKPFGVRRVENTGWRGSALDSSTAASTGTSRALFLDLTNSWNQLQNNTNESIEKGFVHKTSGVTPYLQDKDSNEGLPSLESARCRNVVSGTSERSSEVRDDGRNDEIVQDITRHFRGESVPSYNGREGNGPGGTGINNTKGRISHPNNRANVQLPPGWGKTQLALKLIEELYCNGLGYSSSPLRSVIYVTPRLVLVDQLFDHIDRFGSLNSIPHSHLIVASKSNTTEARTTNPEAIAQFLSADSHDNEDLRLLVCTYNSLPRVGQALSMSKDRREMDLAIFDEAHGMEGLGKMTGYGLYDRELPTRYRLFLTATPQRYTESPEQRAVLGSRLRHDGSNMLVSKKTGERRKGGVRSFDDFSLFGPCVAKRTFRESVEKNITVSLTLVAIDKAEMQSLLGDSFDSVQSRDELLPFVLQAAFHKLNVTRVVSFHSLVNRSRAFVDGARRVFDNGFTAVAVDGKMSASKREEALMEAKNAPGASVVSNCRLLAEGVDESCWELVFMADAVTSPVLARQMIGRVSRVSPGKERGYVLVPVLVDADYEEDYFANESAGYKWFVSAFQAMVKGDPNLRKDIIYVSEESKRLGRPLVSSEYPQSLQEAFMLPPTMSIEMKNNLMERVVVEVGDANTWDRMYNLLVIFKEREGHCIVPTHFVENGSNLGFWLQNQRKSFKQGTIDAGRKQLLDDLGVVWDVLQERWETMFSLLLQHKERVGHCVVPHDHMENGLRLGKWLNRQRELHRKKKLDWGRMKRLEEAGVVLGPIKAQWEEMHAVLLHFKEREEHCDVPKAHKEDGLNLGNWIDRQRTLYRIGSLEPLKLKLLEEAGLTWRIYEERWNRSFASLLKFKEREGHCDVPSRHVEDGMNLGSWVNRQRKLKRKGKLEKEREQFLDEIGITWSFKS